MTDVDRTIAVIAVVVAVISLGVAVFAFTSDSGNDDTVDEYQRILDCADQIRKYTDIKPEVAIVLGSGLSDVVNRIDVKATVPYSDIKGFPVSTVAGHAGNFIFGELGGKEVVAMQGRVHYYEGYSVQDVVLPIRVVHELGAQTIIITNAAGTMHEYNEPGTFMVIRDQIASLMPSPLRGPNISELGERFVPMGEVYNKQLSDRLMAIALEKGSDVCEGVYIQVPGPQYETPQEIEAYRSWGADAVGMSTAIEATAAVHMGMEICGVSCLTNYTTDLSVTPLSHEEVQKITKEMSGEIAVILEQLISEIN